MSDPEHFKECLLSFSTEILSEADSRDDPLPIDLSASDTNEPPFTSDEDSRLIECIHQRMSQGFTLESNKLYEHICTKVNSPPPSLFLSCLVHALDHCMTQCVVFWSHTTGLESKIS